MDTCIKRLVKVLRTISIKKRLVLVDFFYPQKYLSLFRDHSLVSTTSRLIYHPRAPLSPEMHYGSPYTALRSHPAVCEWAIIRAERTDAAAPPASCLNGLVVACYLLQRQNLPGKCAHGQRKSCRSVSRVPRQALCMESGGPAAVELWYRLRARIAASI